LLETAHSLVNEVDRVSELASIYTDLALRGKIDRLANLTLEVDANLTSRGVLELIESSPIKLHRTSRSHLELESH
jgi:hypothetical protein